MQDTQTLLIGLLSFKAHSAAVAAALALTLFAPVTFAQTENSVTLKYDDGTGVTGELLEFTDNKFRLRSSVGTVVINADGVTCTGSACPASAVEPSVAETAPEPEPEAPSDAITTITAKNGSLSITGTILAIEDNAYILQTSVGALKLQIDMVDCEGPGCVEAPAEVAGVTLGGNVVMRYGEVAISGTLKELEEDAFVIDNEVFGIVRLSRSTFICEGPGCPEK